MNKIVIFNGSPRKKGTVTQIINEIAKGARGVGREVITYDLNNPEIRDCQGCMYCKKNNDFCCQKDYLQSMYQDIVDSDTIVFGSPIYMHKITGQSKIWIDRLYPMVDIKHNALYPNKKLLTVYSQGAPIEYAFADEFEYIKNILKIMGWEEVERLIYTSSNPSDLSPKVTDEFLEKAYAIGKQLA
jgi:multimeric flavodoxin WrbA